MAAPAYRSHTVGTGANASNVTGTEPSGAALDDILVAVLYIESDTAITPPSGWSTTFSSTTMLAEANNASGAFRAYGYWIRRGGSAPSLTWLHAAAYRQLNITAYTGALSSADPWSFGAVAVRDTTVDTSFPSLSGTTTDTDETLVWVGSNFDGGASSTQPTGFTERYEITSNDITSADKAQAVAGATGTVTGASWSGSNGTAVSLLGGLRPTGGAPAFLAGRPRSINQAVNRAGTY